MALKQHLEAKLVHITSFGRGLMQGALVFQKSRSYLESPRYQHGDMNQVPHWEPTDSRHHCTKFICQGNLSCGICMSLVWSWQSV